uniref:Uncharacterized protein n=1 Tax=Dulem virus 32 TaxID=3145750 RepID=A0AAU8B2M8_9CAUD
MASPFSGYWLALVDGEEKACRLAYLVSIHVGLPILGGSLALLGSGPLAKSQVINVVAILAGLLFSMSVLLIDLRGRVRRGEDNRAAVGDRNCQNLDHAYEVTNYSILIGFTASGLLLGQEQIWPLLPSWGQIASNWVIYAFVINFGLAVLHCLRRLRRCYEVFGKGNS